MSGFSILDAIKNKANEEHVTSSKSFTEMSTAEKCKEVDRLIKEQEISGMPIELDPEIADFMGAAAEPSMSLVDAINATDEDGDV